VGQRVVEAMGEDGRGAVMIDGKMQDDATFKQCKVVLELGPQPGRARRPSCQGVRRDPAIPDPPRPDHARSSTCRRPNARALEQGQDAAGRRDHLDLEGRRRARRQGARPEQALRRRRERRVRRARASPSAATAWTPPGARTTCAPPPRSRTRSSSRRSAAEHLAQVAAAVGPRRASGRW
jgi:hypothetical protein